MGVGSSKKKKNLAAKAPQPPKPLTAVSEGEEQAWSTAQIDEDREESMFKSTIPAKPPKGGMLGVSAGNTTELAQPRKADSTRFPGSRAEASNSIEQKDESPVPTRKEIAMSTGGADAAPSNDEIGNSETSFRPSEDGSYVSENTEKKEDSEYQPSGGVTEVPVVEEVPAPREPTPDPLQEGGYLVFSTVSDGTLHLCYSHSKVEGAIAYFRPNRVVPAFKFRQNHGRVELIRRLVNNKQGYFEGFADFIKSAKEFDSEVCMLQPVAKIYYQANTSSVYEAKIGEFFPTRISTVAVIPPSNESFEGVRSLSPEQFVSTGNKYGKALKF